MGGIFGGGGGPSGPSQEEREAARKREERADTRERRERQGLQARTRARARGGDRQLMFQARDNAGTGVAPPQRTLGPSRNPRQS